MPGGSVKLEGEGVHNGRPSAITISMGAGSGCPCIYIQGVRLPVLPLMGAECRLEALNSTVIHFTGGSCIRASEHLLAALLAFPGEHLIIQVEGEEVPMLEGSAGEIYKTLQTLSGRTPGPANTCISQYNTAATMDLTWENGYFRAERADKFTVEYHLERGECSQRALFSLEAGGGGECFEDIIKARTFIFWTDYQRCLFQGLLKGRRAQSGHLIAANPQEYAQAQKQLPEGFCGHYPFLNSPALQFTCELAMHKILDLMGDLAVARLALPRLKILIKNGGHYHNHLLLKEILHGESNSEPYIA